ncbi:hypothetical protein A6A06_02245 [Streptomyces sp. CB02923]|uniref:hypothetical protein n=1 Tax=Streptomyces sp. CB02923 TaxID=1718985 RepID=UPI00093E5326|nr:hypothetical protein [Streptomyces sp. CB02923]OKI09525.1 hypothetical protein A6A06_02245 [Streptomyces sp. CB02923]
MNEGWYRLLSILVFTAGFWEGPAAVLYRVFGDDHGTPMRAVNYLDSPWNYVASGVIALLAFALLAVLDKGREKALARARDAGAARAHAGTHTG